MKKYSLHNRRANLSNSLGPNISYQTLPNSENSGKEGNRSKRRALSDIIPPGPSPALSPAMDTAPKLDPGEPVIPISNLPQSAPLPDDIPDEYRFEIFRLRRQIAALNSDIRHVNDKLTKALEVLQAEVRFWRLGIYEGQWETLGQVMRRMKHLEALVKALEGPGALAAQAETRKRQRP